MNLYEIRQKLAKYEKAVFTLNELSRIIEKPKDVAAVYARRMCNKKLLFKLEKNKFSTSDDIFIIASQLIFPSYLGLSSALYLHNQLSQIIDKLYILSPKQVKAKKILDTLLIFIKIKPKLMFGYKKEKKGNSFILMSDLEKTIIDCLLYPQHFRSAEITGSLKSANVGKLEDYLRLANKEVLNRKIGYLLDCLNIPHNIIRRTKTIYKLNPKIKKRGRFNNKWFLYVNEEMS